MNVDKSGFSFVLACAALTFSLAVCAQAQTITYLAQSPDDGWIIQATDGNFYGSGAGGARYNGEIFRMTPHGEISTLYSFCAQVVCEGALPPILGSDGNLYGVTSNFENSNQAGGVFYKLTLSGDFTTLYTFCANSGCAGGLDPNAVIQASDGNFYGTTAGGGNGGTIFSISPAGEFKLLYTFCSLANCTDGVGPGSPPAQGNDGNFYGVTRFGGAAGLGAVYKLTTAGAYSVLYSFCSLANCSDGTQPQALTLGPDGNLFGLAQQGGFDNCGTVFQISPKGRFVVLHRFNEFVDGCTPFNALTWANDGNLYAVNRTEQNGGFIFEIAPDGKFTSVYDFSCCNGGTTPYGTLFQGTDGGLYGETQGSVVGGSGTIFKFSNNLSPLIETVPVAGSVGQQVIILGNHLTGTTGVTFNGTPATFSVVSETEITANVPDGATTGPARATERSTATRPFG
jgi:uncharacterized repeat protein (TIGR03803 family)